VRSGSGPRRGRPLTGSIEVVGDKSISHRAVLLAALAAGRSRLRGLNAGADVAATATIVAQMGAVHTEHNGELEVDGWGERGAREPDDVLDCGNSGTSLRTILGICAGAEGEFVLTGDDTLRRRPMLRVVVPLREMGAAIDGRDHGNRAPLTVRGSRLTGIDHEPSIASAQVKTALLLAGLAAEGTTSISEPGDSRDHTERMLAAVGIDVEVAARSVRLKGGQIPDPLDLHVPGDPSAAAFLVGGALLVPGSDLTIERVGVNPTRTGLFEVLTEMGADVTVESSGMTTGEPWGRIRARHSDLHGVDVDPGLIPRSIDEIPILAVIATQAEGTTRITGAGELRVKESDRIDTVVTGLRGLGASIEALPDGLVVEGPTPLRGGGVDPHGDHRIALSAAIAGLISADKVTVSGWSCVDTSFPGFLDTLNEALDDRATKRSKKGPA